jgi:hypothetical protein
LLGIYACPRFFLSLCCEHFHRCDFTKHSRPGPKSSAGVSDADNAVGAISSMLMLSLLFHEVLLSDHRPMCFAEGHKSGEEDEADDSSEAEVCFKHTIMHA